MVAGSQKVFTILSHPQKNEPKSLFLNFLIKKTKKSRGKWFGTFEDGIKAQISSEIKPPLKRGLGIKCI